MFKKELVSVIHSDLNFGYAEYKKTEVTKIVNMVFERIGDQLMRGDNVAINKFGSFKVHESPARQARNPRTGETVDVPAKKRVKFKASSALNSVINQ